MVYNVGSTVLLVGLRTSPRDGWPLSSPGPFDMTIQAQRATTPGPNGPSLHPHTTHPTIIFTTFNLLVKRVNIKLYNKINDPIQLVLC